MLNLRSILSIPFKVGYYLTVIIFGGFTIFFSCNFCGFLVSADSISNISDCYCNKYTFCRVGSNVFHVKVVESLLNSAYKNIYEKIAKEDLSESIQDIDFLKKKAATDFRYIQPYLGESVLEVGPGYGHLADLLCKAGVSLTLSDVIPNYLDKFEQRGRVTSLIADAQELGLSASFDLIIMCDVLEHVFRPSDVLFWVYSALKPGGYAYIRVPSFEANLFYSRNHGFPYELVHLRTYTPDLLTREVLAAGFRVVKRAAGFGGNQRVPFNRIPGGKHYWNLKRSFLNSKYTTDSPNFPFFTKLIAVLLDGAFGMRTGFFTKVYSFLYRFASKPSEIFIVIQKPVL